MMVEKDVILKYNEILNEIETFLLKKNFRACRSYSLDLVRLSSYFKFIDGIFISEFIGNLVGDLENISSYILEEEDTINDLSSKLSTFIKFIKLNIPFRRDNVWNLFESMRDIRTSVTLHQLKTIRISVKKRRYPPFLVEEE